jgi:N-acylneuraminate cytidylyltransferase
LDVLQRSGAQYALTVTNFAAPIQRSFRITSQQRIEMFNPAQFTTRSQDLEEAYHDAGQFYWGRAQAWLAATPLFSEATAPIVLPRYRVQDIDNQEDWIRAELMFGILNQTTER